MIWLKEAVIAVVPERRWPFPFRCFTTAKWRPVLPGSPAFPTSVSPGDELRIKNELISNTQVLRGSQKGIDPRGLVLTSGRCGLRLNRHGLVHRQVT